jgi:hypothetical protein
VPWFRSTSPCTFESVLDSHEWCHCSSLSFLWMPPRDSSTAHWCVDFSFPQSREFRPSIWDQVHRWAQPSFARTVQSIELSIRWEIFWVLISRDRSPFLHSKWTWRY